MVLTSDVMLLSNDDDELVCYGDEDGDCEGGVVEGEIVGEAVG